MAPLADKAATSDDRWTVLVADDDESVIQLTKLLFATATFDGKRINVLSARSGREAREILSERTDIAVVILDIVMEREDAGIEAAKWIRSQAELSRLRIVIRSGQPGSLDERALIEDLNIQDYWSKTELTSSRMRSRLALQLRAYAQSLPGPTKTQAPEQWLVQAGQEPTHSAAMIRALAEVIVQARGSAIPLRGGGHGVILPGSRPLPLQDIIHQWQINTTSARWWVTRTAYTEPEIVVRPEDMSPSSAPGLYLSSSLSPKHEGTAGGWVNASHALTARLRQVAYTSKYKGDNLSEDIAQIFNSSAYNNALLGVSGILLVVGDSFFQVLEGPREVVKDVLERVIHDKRHTEVRILTDSTVTERQYKKWGMQAFHIRPEGAATARLQQLVMSLSAEVTQPELAELLHLAEQFTTVDPH